MVNHKLMMIDGERIILCKATKLQPKLTEMKCENHCVTKRVLATLGTPAEFITNNIQ
jgi:hypothetical protein